MILSFLLTMGLCDLAQAQNLERYNWHPIRQITMQEIELIECSSHKLAVDILGRALFFAVANNTVILWRDDNVLCFYSANLLNKQPSPTLDIKESMEERFEMILKKEKQLSDLLTNFMNAWRTLPEDRKVADELAKIFFRELSRLNSSDTNFASITAMLYVFAARGNRYRREIDSYLDSIISFVPYVVAYQGMEIYNRYLEAESALPSDVPDNFARQMIFQRIVNFILRYPTEPIIIPPHTLDAMKKESPDLYKIVREEIEKRGVG